MKILITGGAGFIGSHLCDLLIDKHQIYILDDLSTGSIENIEHLKEHKNFHYFIDCITNQHVLRELIDKCDVVFHLAAAVGVKLIVEKPIKTIETNVHGTELILKFASLKNKRLIIASTSEVYGKNPKSPFSEADDLVLGSTKVARWSYACSKAIDEYLAMAYFMERKLPVTVVRFFNTVGPRQIGHYGMVVPRFIKAALNNQELNVYGDGNQKRCFGHVIDVVEALERLLICPDSHGEILNIGRPEEVTINHLANKIIEKCASSSKIRYTPFEKVYGTGFEDMKQRVPDITLAQKIINFNPKRYLDNILEDTIKYFKGESYLCNNSLNNNFRNMERY